MSTKLQGLSALKWHLRFVSRSILKRVLTSHRDAMSTPTYEQHLLQAGQLAVWMGELDDHLYYLPLLQVACEHGLQGTMAEGYEEDGYEGWEEPATPTEPYDAYEDMRLLLGTDSTFGVLTLSPGLLEYVAHLPEQRRRSAVQPQDGEVLMTTKEDGQYRPMTPAEIEQLGDQVYAEAQAEFAFVLSYAQELAHLKALVEQRGDLQQIRALLE